MHAMMSIFVPPAAPRTWFHLTLDLTAPLMRRSHAADGPQSHAHAPSSPRAPLKLLLL